MGTFTKKVASAVSIVALTATTLGTSVVSAASEFLPYAKLLADNGVINTSTEAGYRMSDNITRAEISKIAANLGEYEMTACNSTLYTDVNSSLGDLCDAITTLANAGVVSTSYTNFRPNDLVTRAEMTKILLGANGETASTTSAGYQDVTSALGDLAGYINRANELGCAANAMYFRPNAASSRGEAFKVAACAGDLEIPTTPTTPTTPTNTGSTNTGTLQAGLNVALEGEAVAQYVPMNASSVKVGTIKLTAKDADATVSTVTINRSGLGSVRNLKASLGQNGVTVANARTFNSTTNEAIVRLNTPLTLKKGESATFDILVSLPSDEAKGATPNSQHQFTVKAVAATDAATTVSGTPITLGLINTTSYLVQDVEVSNLTAETVSSGLKATRIANIEFEAPNRPVILNGFTISKSSGNNLSDAIANVKVYRNGVLVDATVNVTSDKIIVTGLNTTLENANTAKYELRADTIYIGNNGEFKIYIANTEDVSAVEKDTGYTTMVTNSAKAEKVLKIDGIKLTTTLVDTTTKDVAPGSSSVNFLDGKVTSSSSFEVRNFELTPTITDPTTTGSTTAISRLKDIYSSLTLNIAGSSYDLLEIDNYNSTSQTYKFDSNESFIMDAGSDYPVRVRGTVKSNVNSTDPLKYDDVKFTLKITNLKNIENGNTIGIEKDLVGNTIKIKSPTLDVRNATVAAPTSSKIVSSKNNVEIGRFAFQAKYADVRVSKITMEPTTASTLDKFTLIANNASSFRLVNVADGSELDATKELNGTGNILTFTLSPAVTITKDTIQNYKLLVNTKTIDSANLGKHLKVKFAVNSNDVSTDYGTATLTSGDEEGKKYTTAIGVPTIKVTPLTLGANLPVATVTVNNNDSDNNVQIQNMKIRVQARSTANGTVDFNSATICLRNRGATVACTATGQVVETTGSGIGLKTFNFTVDSDSDTNLDINAAEIITTNSSTDFDVYLDGAPLWVAGDYVAVSIEEANYKYGNYSTTATMTTSGTDLSDSYIGDSDATATTTK